MTIGQVVIVECLLCDRLIYRFIKPFVPFLPVKARNHSGGRPKSMIDSFVKMSFQ